MATDLIRKPHTRGKDQPLKKKTCHFPGCTEEFMGRGKTKYCEEHRKPMYRAQLYGRPADESAVNDINGTPVPTSELNITMKHTYIEAVHMERKCECCGKVYRIIVIPSQYVYPRYCDEHRNEWKRNNFLRINGGINEEKPFTSIQKFRDGKATG